MAFTEQLNAAIASATYPQLHQLSRDIWRAWSAGTIGDAEAQEAGESIAARKRALGAPRSAPRHSADTHRPEKLPAVFPPRRIQRSPDRIASIQRRRRLAMSGPMPPVLACKFTVGELAVLRIVADEVRGQGTCSRHIDAIAARAGVCRSTAQNAIREAQRLGLLVREERRRRGQPSLTNVVRIVSREWTAWLDHKPQGVGFKKLSTADNKDRKRTLDKENGKIFAASTVRGASP